MKRTNIVRYMSCYLLFTLQSIRSMATIQRLYLTCRSTAVSYCYNRVC